MDGKKKPSFLKIDMEISYVQNGGLDIFANFIAITHMTTVGMKI